MSIANNPRGSAGTPSNVLTRTLRRLVCLSLALLPLGLSAHQGGGWLDGGLTGEYFANNNFSGSPQFTRSDVRLSFAPEAELAWGGSRGSPFAGFPTDNFSIRWTGQMKARFTQTYTFKTVADDAFKLEIKKASDPTYTTVINQTGYLPGGTTGTMALLADTAYDVRIEYKELTGSAQCTLTWSAASVPEEVIDVCTELSMNYNTYKEQIYADAMKGGRSNWEQVSGEPTLTTDTQGWPQGDCDFIFSETLTPHDVSPWETGDMALRFNGKATLTTFGNCSIVSGSQQYDAGTNTTTAIVRGVDNNGNVLTVRFRNTDRDGDFGGDGLADKDGFTNMQLMRLDGLNGTPLPYDMLFHPKARTAFGRLTALRFQRTNDQSVNWSDRTQPYSAFSGKSLLYVYNSRYNGGAWNLKGQCGLPHEREIMLCNELGCDYYVTIPHLATVTGSGNYTEKLARLIRYGSDANGEPYSAPTANPVYPPLNPNLRAYVEISNELWNFASLSSYAPYFDYKELIEDKADANDADFQILNFDNLALTVGSDGYYTNNWTWVRRYWGLKLKQISDAFRGVFGDAAMPGNGNLSPRVRPYFTWQYADANATASTGLKFMDTYFNNGDGLSHVATPRPVNYYFWCGGGAGYYSSANKDAFTEVNPIPNKGFEAPDITGMTTNPSGATWTFNANSGMVNNATRTNAVSSATPGPTSTALSNYVGCKFTVGATPITVYELGRWVFSGNSKSHTVQIARASDGLPVTSASVNTSGAATGAFLYARCIPVTLQANTAYYLLSSEATAADAVGDGTSTVTTNGSITVNLPARATTNGTTFSFTDESGAGRCYGPLALKYSNALLLASGTPLNNPDTMDESDDPADTQCAWIQSLNGTQGQVQVNFTLPATQVDNHYAVSFRWTKRTQFLSGSSDSPNLKIYAIIGGNTQEITPLDSNTQPQQWSTSNEWKRVAYWVGNYFYSETFTGAAAATVTLRFVGNNTSGDHVTFLDDIRLTSADAFYAAPIPSTGAAMGQTAAGYEENQYGDGWWCAAYGLEQMTYEHGFSAGGDSGNSAIQNYVKFVDPRAKQSVIDCIAIFQQGGGRLPTFGTYSTWPAFEPISGVRVEGTDNASSWALTQGMDEMLDRLPELPLNGDLVPCTIAGADKTLANGGSGTTLNAGNWFTYDIVVAQPGTYSAGVETTGSGQVQLSLDGTTVVVTGTGGATLGGSVYLPWGHHTLRVKCTSGSVGVTNVIVDSASQAPTAPGSFSASVNQTTLAVSLSWTDQSSGAGQELWFDIQRATDVNFTQNLSAYRITANSTSWTDPTQLAVATTYYYRIRSFNLAAPSSWVTLSAGVVIDVPPPSNLLYHSDDFDSTARTLHGATTGTGWSAAWSVQNSDVTIPGFEIRTTTPLSYAGLIASGSGYAIGGRAYLTSGRAMDLAAWPYFFKKTVSSVAYLGADGTTVWMSALIRVDKTNTSGAFLTVSSNTTPSSSGDHKAGVNISNGKWGLRVKNASNAWVTTETASTVTVGQTYLLVLKFAFGSTDNVSLYVNPTGLGGAAPGTPSASADVGLDAIFRTFIFNPDESVEQGSLDDLRVGDSFAAVTPSPVVAVPEFSPVAGTYQESVAVTISTATSGASLRYTTDGSTPTSTTGTLYSNPVNLTVNTTLKAIAYKAGMTDSSVASGAYTIDHAPVITTTTLPNGTQGSAYSQTLQATGGDGALSWSLLSGSLPAGLDLSTSGVISGTPTGSGTSNFTVQVADADSDTDDQPLSITINAVFVDTPSFSPTAGTFATAQTVTISCATSGATIKYTTDGSTPSRTAGTTYSAPVSISQNTTLKAMAYKDGLSDSTVASGTYNIKVAAPSFTPAAGTYATAQTVTIATTTSGATIRYTTDGSTPSQTVGTVYSTPVAIAATTTLKAIAYKTGLTDSDVTVGVYTIGGGSDQILAEEVFNYTPDTILHGLTGGGSVGWNGTWVVEGGTAATGYKIVADSLLYGDLFTAGHKLQGGHSYQTCGRAFDIVGTFAGYNNASNLIGADGQTLWLAWVVKLASTANGYSGKVALDYGGSIFHDNNGIVRVRKTDATGQWTLSLLNEAHVQSTGIAATTNPTLMVLRIQFGASDTVDLWVNPPLYSTNPGTPSATLSTTGTIQFNELAYYPQSGAASGWLDEVRVGTSYAAVTPTVEEWLPADIGAVAAAGSSSISGDGATFTVIGSGADIWGTADEFQFCRLQGGCNGDAELVARVTSVQNTNGWAKAGVMIRETSAANSRHAMMVVTPSSGVSFQRRTTAGGTSASTTTSGQTAPKWLKISRTGNIFRAYWSNDNITWTKVGSDVTIAMAATAEIGLCVTSHADGTLCTAVFDNVTVTP